MRQEKSRRKQSPTDFRWRKTAWRTKRESFITYQTQRDNEIPLISKKYANQKRKREDLNKIGYENVRSFFCYWKKMSSAKEKKKKRKRENVWFADLWWWSRPSGGRCSTTPGGKGDGTRVIQFKLQSDRDKDDRTLAVGVSMVSFNSFADVKTIWFLLNETKMINVIF